jgi:PPM family protein phosphatase
MSEPTPVTLQWFGWTDIGRVRKNNEDAFLGLTFDAREVHRLGKIGHATNEHSDFVFAVGDGMGGARAGELASNIAVEKITTLLPRSYKLSALGLNAGVDDVLDELFTQIHRALVYVGDSYEECRGMETTLSLAWFAPGWMYFAHVGDTRIYRIAAREQGMKLLTHDDTHVGWLLRNGKIGEYEARNHPQRNVLQKALGGGNQFVDPQVGAVAYEPGDIFLLCSDGLTEGIFDATLEHMLCSPDTFAEGANAAQILVNEAVKSYGKDNTTALVVRVM